MVLIITKLIKISHLKEISKEFLMLNNLLAGKVMADKTINFRQFCQKEIKSIEMYRKVQSLNKLTFYTRRKIQVAKEELLEMQLNQAMLQSVQD